MHMTDCKDWPQVKVTLFKLNLTNNAQLGQVIKIIYLNLTYFALEGEGFQNCLGPSRVYLTLFLSHGKRFNPSTIHKTKSVFIAVCAGQFDSSRDSSHFLFCWQKEAEGLTQEASRNHFNGFTVLKPVRGWVLSKTKHFLCLDFHFKVCFTSTFL